MTGPEKSLRYVQECLTQELPCILISSPVVPGTFGGCGVGGEWENNLTTQQQKAHQKSNKNPPTTPHCFLKHFKKISSFLKLSIISAPIHAHFK